MRTGPGRRYLVAGLACVVVAIAAGALGAANVTGTAGRDTLRGSSAADKLYGRAGNDKLYGLAGNDMLAGGAGNDVLVGGPGSDRLSCGAGRDTANADAKDKVGKDCEVVKGIPLAPPPAPPPPPSPPPPPTPPPPPPASPVTAGNYQGQTQNGNFVFFTVTPDRAVTGIRINSLPLICDPGARLDGAPDFGDATIPIGADGTFGAEDTWTGSVVDGDIEFTSEYVKITGKFDQTASASGTILLTLELKYQGTPYRCSSGVVNWTATRQS